MVFKEFHRPTKTVQSGSESTFFKSDKYNIALQNYIIKLTTNVLIKMYHPNI